MSPTIELTQGQVWYRDVYLKSEHWEKTAHYFKEMRNFTCEECGKRSWKLDVHHNGYNGGYKDETGRTLLWREHERPDLIQVLCRKCHEEKHSTSPFTYNFDDIGNLFDLLQEEAAEELAIKLLHGEIDEEDLEPDHLAFKIALREWTYALSRSAELI